jgi:hypothetical protein
LENDQIEIIRVTSEDEAWRLFRHLVEGGDVPESFQLEFDGWPSLGLKVNGRDWVSSIPTRALSPLMDAQKDIHRAYARIKYGSDNLRRLSDEERDSLELVIKIGEGSTDMETPLSRQLNTLGLAAINKMESKHLAIVILGIALTWGSNEAWKAWLASRQAEVQAESQVRLSAQETDRMRIFAQAMSEHEDLGKAKADFESTHNSILKTLKPGDRITSKGVELQSYEARELTQSDRARSEDIDIRGTFRVVANDASKGAGFRIKVVSLDGQKSFSAEVPMELDADQKRLIQRAEWSKGNVLVDLHISASALRGKITNAIVYSATEHNQPQSQE